MAARTDEEYEQLLAAVQRLVSLLNGATERDWIDATQMWAASLEMAIADIQRGDAHGLEQVIDTVNDLRHSLPGLFVRLGPREDAGDLLSTITNASRCALFVRHDLRD